MGINKDGESILRPRKDSVRLHLPITFEYSRGRMDSNKTTAIWVGAFSVIGLLFGIGIMFSKEGFFLFNIAWGLLILFIFSVIIRFGVLKEHKIRNKMLELADKDNKEEYEDMWGIYSVDDTYPYYARMRNGKTALFIRFEKDVILGKRSDSRYEHYEAIGDAYNQAGAMGVSVCHLDYMDVIGTDDRLAKCFDSLQNVSNPDMLELLTDVYTNLQELLNEKMTTFDVYVFTFKSGEASFWYQIQGVINCMLSANYRSFKILNQDDLRSLCKSIFNMHDFSVYEAYLGSLKASGTLGITPISVMSSDGTFNKLNKTLAEKKEEQELREEINNGKQVLSDNDEIDIF